MTDAPSHPTADPQHVLLERMLFFSDAVFAIVLTLLALELRMPAGIDDAHLLRGLAEIQAEIVAFAVSFALVGVFWLAHLMIMRSLASFDWLVAAANLVFLFTVAVIPFGALLVGEDGTLGNAWRFYCASIVAIGLAQAALLVVIHRDEQRLVLSAHHGRLIYRLIRAFSPAIAFAVGLALSFAGARTLSSYCYVLAPLILLISRWLEDRAGRDASDAAGAPAANV